jgi:glycine hydroxymethyltransferase
VRDGEDRRERVSGAGATTDPALERPWASPVVQERLAEIQRLGALGSDEELAAAGAAADAVRRALDDDGLVLYAGTNAPLADAEEVHDVRIGVRGITGDPGETARPGIPGIDGVDVLEVLTARAVGATMRAPFADVRPQSATLANLAVYAGLTPPGATIAALAARAGGHFSHHEHGAAGIRGHRVAELPFDPERQDVDLERLPAFLAHHEPRLVILGGSVQLFANDVAAVAEEARRAGARLLFDASHTAGLIAGGAFPNPLEGGADAVTFSTYKSYGGPPGGAIALREAGVAQAVAAAVFPGLTANYDASRLRPLLFAARWLLREGEAYAAGCVAAARALAQALVADGLDVMAAARGYTETNQLLVRMEDRPAADAAVARCAAAGVYLSAAEHCDERGRGAALRLGTQELVRRGLGPRDMEAVARLLAALLRGTATSVETRRDVHALRELMASHEATDGEERRA